MKFQLNDKTTLFDEVKKRLQEKSMKFNDETLGQFIASKACAVNQIKAPTKPVATKTEINLETLRHWVRDFIRLYCLESH